MADLHNKIKRNGLLALSPMLVMVILFVLLGWLMGGFSNVPPLMVFLLTSVYALFTLRGVPADKRIDIYSEGAGEVGLLLMVWIFVLAGAFVEAAKEMGAIESIVNLTLSFLPPSLLLPGLFFASCLISISIGSAFGTVVALAPIAVGISDCTGIGVLLLLGASTGGAFFGDNLSFISDTTIAATRSQGCEMKDKFRENIRFALPAALITAAVYIVLGNGHTTQPEIGPYNFVLVIPYLSVLVLAILGMNVMLVLFIGIALTGIIGVAHGSYTTTEWIGAVVKGIESMGGLCFIALMVGGTLQIMKKGGGLTWLMRSITKRVHGHKGAEMSIAALGGIVCASTAYNTIAILSVGQLSKNIAERYRITPRRTASLLDASTCGIQGLLPYGAHLLFASSTASVSSFELVAYEFYPMILILCLLATIAFKKK